MLDRVGGGLGRRDDGDEVTAATARLAEEGLPTATEENTACCYAVQDKVWVTGPGDEPWEVYVAKGDADTLAKTADSVCCAPAAEADGAAQPSGACC